MKKKLNKIGIAIDNEVDKKLEEGNYNKSKLINSLLNKWFILGKKNVDIFKWK